MGHSIKWPYMVNYGSLPYMVNDGSGWPPLPSLRWRCMALKRFATMQRALGDCSEVELNSTLKAITVTKYECESESPIDYSLWSPLKHVIGFLNSKNVEYHYDVKNKVTY